MAGTIPASLGNLTNLKYAVLKFNNLTGALCSSPRIISIVFCARMACSLSVCLARPSYFCIFWRVGRRQLMVDALGLAFKH